MNLLIHSNIIFVIDMLFFSNGSKLISTTWIATDEKREMIVIVECLSVVTEDYCYLFAIELFSFLSILIAVNYFLLNFLYPLIPIQIKIKIDY